MRIFAISDLHLSFSGAKPMDVFGPWWSGHWSRVEAAWRELVGAEDVVCLPGDFSWALRPEEVRTELSWLGSLPGRKVLVRGNHDYWWGSISKVRSLLPKGVYALQNDCVRLGDAVFAGTRGWVDPTLSFDSFSGHGVMGEEGRTLDGLEEDRKIYLRELGRMETSLGAMSRHEGFRVALVHFPPIDPSLVSTEMTALFEKYRVGAVVFGHVHRQKETDFANPFGVLNGVRYYLASADFVNFTPLEILMNG